MSDEVSAISGESPVRKKERDKFVVLEPCRDSIKELIELVEEKNLADIIYAKTPLEAMIAAAKNLPCMLTMSINDNNDVGPNYQVFQKLDFAMEHQGLKVMVVTPIKSRKLAFLFFKRFSVTEYVEEPMPARTFQFKALQLLRAVDGFRKEQHEKMMAAGAKIRPPLRSTLDFFRVDKGGVKRVGKNFTIDVEGPDPATGLWIPNDPGEYEPTSWRWVSNEERMGQQNGEIPPNGWVVLGNRPIYNEESKTWNLTSEKLSLQLQHDGQTIAEKIGMEESGLVFMAKDQTSDDAKKIGAEGHVWNNRIGEGKEEVAPAWNNKISGTKDELHAWNNHLGEAPEKSITWNNRIKTGPVAAKRPNVTIIKGDPITGGVNPLKPTEEKMIVRGIDFTNKKDIRKIPILEKFLVGQIEKAKNFATPMRKMKNEGPPSQSMLFRSMLVVLADAFATISDPKARMENILNAMETTFSSCFAAFTGKPDTEGNTPILFRSQSAPPVSQSVSFEDGIAEAVHLQNSEPPEVLGYLILKTTGRRKTFSPAEEAALKQVALELSPLLSKKTEAKKAG